MSCLLITGASGRVGTLLRPLPARPGREVRLLGIAPPPGPAQPGEVVFGGSVTDADAVAKACDGAGLVVHPGGYASERPWGEILAVNVEGTRTVLEGARLRGVPRVLPASSTHVAGMVAVGEVAGFPVRPDTFHGFGKAAGEALGHHLVRGISRNTRRWASLAAGEAIGFRPRDDAEEHAGAFPGAAPPGSPPDGRVGGVWGEGAWEVGGTW